MFGNNWGQNNQQQQPQQPQQPAGGLFGQPAQQQPAFGATPGAFGTTSAFGNGQQQQQPAGGLFGQPAQNTQPTTGFGGFGAQQKPGFGATGGTFGATPNQPANATPFGGFGAGTSNTTFSANNNNNPATGGLFGRPAATAGTTFGTAAPATGGLFGAKPPTTGAFGTTVTAAGNGTASPSYQVFTEKETTGANSHYQSITCMPAYRTFSFEELRLQDYVPATGGGLFGATTSAFGQQNQTQPPAGGLFGSSTATGTGLFGQKPATTSVFGQSAPTQAAPAFGGGFGQNNAAPTTGLFGQPAQNQQNQQQQSTGFGFGAGFGATNNDANKGLFGNNTNTQPTTGLFGQPQANQENKPAGFGFGQPQTQQQQPANNLFGAQQPTQATQPASGLFGNTFGQNNQQSQTQPAAGGGLFGTGTSLFAPKATVPTTGGLFGAQQQQPAVPTNLFGSTTQASGGLFGGFNSQPQQQQQQLQQPQQQQSGLFGAKPAGTGLFGNSTLSQPQQTGTGLFGNNLAGGQATNPQPTMFGSQSLSGFGQQGQQPQPQPTMIATIDSNFYNTNPLLQSSANGPPHITTFTSKPGPPILYTKKAIPRVNVPKVGRLRGFSTPPQDALSGSTSFGSSVTGSPLNRPLSASSNRLGSALGGLSLSESISSGGLNPDAFKPKSSVKKLVLPSKVDPSSWSESVDAASRAVQAEFGASTSSAGSGLGLSMSNSRSKVTWDPQLGRAARESTMLAGRPSPGPGTPQTLSGLGRSQPRLSGPSPSQSFGHITEPNDTPSKVPQSVMKNKDRATDPSEKQGEYWTEPSLSRLRGQSFDTLSHVDHFRVNRTGYGSIEFLQPVNLTTLKSVDDIPGTYVVLDLKECVVYPDESEKPPAGEGLNVPSRIVLTGCWPIDKSTQEPITDPSNPRVAAHIKRLQKIPDAAFVDYEPVGGTWTFEVPHFTRYGLDDDFDDEDVEEDQQDAVSEGQVSSNRSPPPPTTTPVERHPRSVTPESVESEEERSSDEEPHQKSIPLTQHDEEDTGYSPPAHRPWAARLGLDSQRMNVMQASFFHTAPERPASEEPRSAFMNQPQRGEGPSLEGVVEPMGREHQPSTLRSTHTIPIPHPLIRDLQIGKYADSIAVNEESSFVDAGLSLARSFRVGWGPAGQLAFVGRICGSSGT
ncbi:hypothetical protein FRB97_008164, partial [Tulasnella sp. 331]